MSDRAAEIQCRHDLLRTQLDSLTFTDFAEFTSELAWTIRDAAGQGSDFTTWRDSQAMCVVEEAGEFIGEYRRERGFARRPGDRDQVLSELADVIISSMVMFAYLGGDPEERIKMKLGKIITRGYVNKDEDE